MNRTSIAVALLGSVTVALVQVAAFQWSEIGSLKRELRLYQAAKDVADDQVRELSMTLDRAYSERDSVAVKSFVHGVVEAINRPDHFKSVWHDGYNQGMRVFKYATGEAEDEQNH